MREAEETDKVEIERGINVASLRRFKAALIGPTLAHFSSGVDCADREA